MYKNIGFFVASLFLSSNALLATNGEDSSWVEQFSGKGGGSETTIAIPVEKLLPQGKVSYDPGLRHTSPFPPSDISRVDGKEGKLYYKGVPLEELMELPYFEVARKLTGLDFKDSCSPIPMNIIKAMEYLEANADPMWGIRTILSLMAANGLDNKPENLFSLMPTIMAFLIRKFQDRTYVAPLPDLNYAKGFFYMATGLKPDVESPVRDFQIRLLNKLLIAHADHGMNLSTSSARMTTSGYESDQKDYFSSVGSALNSLAGPRHGAANRSVLQMLGKIGQVEKVASYLQKVGEREEILWGFGHRVYKTMDPRAVLFSKLLDELLEKYTVYDQRIKTYIDIANELKKQAAEHHFIKEKNLHPNMDFYSGLLILAMGAISEKGSEFSIPESFLTAFFAWGRLAGWLAHIKEQEGPICRPKGLTPDMVAKL